MKRFVEAVDRAQSTLFPECLDDWIDEDNPVCTIDVFVEELDLRALGFSSVDPEGDGTAIVSSSKAIEVICLRLPEPCPVESTA